MSLYNVFKILGAHIVFDISHHLVDAVSLGQLIHSQSDLVYHLCLELGVRSPGSMNLVLNHDIWLFWSIVFFYKLVDSYSRLLLRWGQVYNFVFEQLFGRGKIIFDGIGCSSWVIFWKLRGRLASTHRICPHVQLSVISVLFSKMALMNTDMVMSSIVQFHVWDFWSDTTHCRVCKYK